jgi:Transposase IS66 family/Family of unknown function (DUF6444)
VTGVPGVPSAEELSTLPAAELAARLAEAYRLIAELTAQAGRPAAQVERLPARVEELERQARKDSSTSSRAPSSDSRSAEAIDAGGVLPGYQGVIVRDGYAGYGHLTSALHPWCAVHLLRDLKGLYDFEPAQQQWAPDNTATPALVTSRRRRLVNSYRRKYLSCNCSLRAVETSSRARTSLAVHHHLRAVPG